MEFGLIPPMFGMGMVNSLSEVIRSQHEETCHVLDLLHQPPLQEAMLPPHPEEEPQKPTEIRCPNPKEQGPTGQCLARSSTTPTTQCPEKRYPRSADRKVERRA